VATGGEEERKRRDTKRGGSEEKETVKERQRTAVCRYSMPIHIQPGVERHEASRK